MTRILLLLIRLATPRGEREWVLGDTLEELDLIERTAGRRASQRWLRREAWRVLLAAPRHRWVLRSRLATIVDRRGDHIMRTIRDDIRYTVRLLKRSPGFALIAVTILGLGIGANTAMFAVVNGVLLKPLPFADPERLMLVHLLAPDRQRGPGAFREVSWSYPKYQSFLKLQNTFEMTAAFASREMSLTDVTEPERLRGEVATEHYLSVLGVTPLFGRSFTREEAHIAGTAPVAMIGEGLWRRRFGADRQIIGRTIHLDRNPHTVVAVLPRGFRGLSGQADIWIPLATYQPGWLTQAQNHSFTLVARRRAEASEPQAAAAATQIGRQLEAEYNNSKFDGGGWSAKAVSLSGSRVERDLRRTTLVLLGAVGFVLLIACVNLTTLVATKALRRSREVAIRIALGATRQRIARQFIVETLVLTVAGAVVGVLLAAAMISASTTLLPDSDTFFRARDGERPAMRGSAGLTQIGAAMIGLDGTTLLFACAIALLCALLIASLPALQASLLRPIEALKAAAASAGLATRTGLDLRGPLVVTQIALSVVLLAGAGLMLKSLARLHGTGIGIDSTRLLTARIQLPTGTYSSDAARAFSRSLIDHVLSIPGIQSAALGNCLPVSGGCNSTLIRFERGRKPFAGNEPGVGAYWASPTYFSTLGIHVLRGRTFTDDDRAGSPKVVVVNEAAARAFWPGKDPIGTFVAIGQGDFNDGAEVVGIVSDVRYGSIAQAPTPDVYVPILQSFQPRIEVFVRSSLQTGPLVSALRAELRALDPNLPMTNVRSMNEQVADATWQTRVSAWLLSAFAGVAIVLTILGLSGVMAQTVAHRTPEFGIRLAIGAEAGHVLRLVLHRALLISSAGLLTGLATAFMLSRAVAALLYDVPAHDPTTYLAVAIGMTVVLLFAAYIPARRALRIEAIAALRSE
jgi:putative ABC transport system permease protein